VQGHFKRDHGFYRDYAEQSRTTEGFAAWLQSWVLDVHDRSTYLKRVDTETLRIHHHQFSAPADYGDE
jgi:hypothetical protein